GVQVAQHAAFFRDHQQAGSVPIQAMDQLQLFSIGPQLTEGFDNPEVQTAAAMDRNAGWLVDHNQRLVFKDNRRFKALQQTLSQRHRLVALRHAHRWHTDNIARLQLVFGLDPPLVHAHFAFTQNAVNQGFRHAFKPSEQEIIDSLAGIFRRDLKQLDAGGQGGSSRHAGNDNNFYGFEALNDCCYSRERRQKRPGQRTNGRRPTLTNAIHQDARPSYGAFATIMEGSRL